MTWVLSIFATCSDPQQLITVFFVICSVIKPNAFHEPPKRPYAFQNGKTLKISWESSQRKTPCEMRIIKQRHGEIAHIRKRDVNKTGSWIRKKWFHIHEFFLGNGKITDDSFVTFNSESMELFQCPIEKRTCSLQLERVNLLLRKCLPILDFSKLTQQQVYITKWLKYSMNFLNQSHPFLSGEPRVLCSRSFHYWRHWTNFFGMQCPTIPSATNNLQLT